jgi:hypothetical protein
MKNDKFELKKDMVPCQIRNDAKKESGNQPNQI